MSMGAKLKNSYEINLKRLIASNDREDVEQLEFLDMLLEGTKNGSFTLFDVWQVLLY